MDKSVISNSCVGSLVYQKLNEQYITPLVGSLFMDDFMYIKFLENYELYTTLKPDVIDNFDKNFFFKLHTEVKHNYPLMVLDDIEIHWIHETSANDVLSNWERRMERTNNDNLVFIWTASEFMQIHDEDERRELINRFCCLPEYTIFLTERPEEAVVGDNFIVKFVPSWKNKTQEDRYPWGFLTWNNQLTSSDEILKIVNV
jgi:uncharacterized protein (DUF1919 family)